MKCARPTCKASAALLASALLESLERLSLLWIWRPWQINFLDFSTEMPRHVSEEGFEASQLDLRWIFVY